MTTNNDDPVAQINARLDMLVAVAADLVDDVARLAERVEHPRRPRRVRPTARRRPRS